MTAVDGEAALRRRFRADRGDAAHRLDRVLVRRCADIPGLSRTLLQAWIGEGRVRVNGAPARRASGRVLPGDEVEVVLAAGPARRGPQAEEIPLDVLYEDEWLIALAKPPGMVVHPNSGHARGTLLNALLWHLEKTGSQGVRPGLVSRLDKDTSGVIVAAKSGAIHGRLARAVRSRSVEKDYLAVVYGAPDSPRGRIERCILPDPADRRRMTTSRTEGRPSVTLWESLGSTEAVAGVRLTLLRCRLVTGRMHQIRVHLKSQGLPIVGDPLYGEPRWKGIADPALAAACQSFPRQALHAWRLAFPHPVTGEALVLRAAFPSDVQSLLGVAASAR